MQDVSAEGIDKTKYSFTNVVDGKITRTIDDGDFTIELVTEEGYRINGCNSPDFMSCTCENNVCNIDVHNYGKGILDISLVDNEWTSNKNDFILVDIGLDEYLDYLIAKIPTEINDVYGLSKYEYVSSLFPKNITTNFSCSQLSINK